MCFWRDTGVRRHPKTMAASDWGEGRSKADASVNFMPVKGQNTKICGQDTGWRVGRN